MTCRRSARSYLHAGGRVEDLSRILGHSNISTTYRRYVRPSVGLNDDTDPARPQFAQDVPDAHACAHAPFTDRAAPSEPRSRWWRRCREARRCS